MRQTEIGGHFDFKTCKDMNASTTVVDLLYTVCALNKIVLVYILLVFMTLAMFNTNLCNAISN